MPRDPDSPWYTRAEAAQYLRVDPKTLDRWRRENRVTSRKIDGIQSVRYHRDDLDACVTTTVVVLGEE
jgi:excisionase family DNA binding protein